MKEQDELLLEDRLIQLLDYFGIEKAHFAGREPNDMKGLAAKYPERIASLTFVCPQDVNAEYFSSIGSRLLVFNGDRGPISEQVAGGVKRLPECTVITLADYFAPGWADVIADRTQSVGDAIIEFVTGLDTPGVNSFDNGLANEGEVAGVKYRVEGSGTPLFLLPLTHAPSQWQALLPRLANDFSTITLGGSELGSAAALESRGRSSGYIGMQRNLFEELQLKPGETVLEVGCGTGVLDRWLAGYTEGANKIVGADLNLLNLREAGALAKKQGFESVIEFKEGNAEQLPFEDNSFDVAFSSTVMEQVNADRMLSEMIRVTKQGGRVGVIVRAEDMSGWINLSLNAELKARIESRLGGRNVSEHGCADASLYRRFQKSSLENTKNFPWLAASDERAHVEVQVDRIISGFRQEEASEVQEALKQAENERTFFIAQPYHCAIGTKTGR